MKNILLASTALVAFAGAAAADSHTSITFSGAASAEYNSAAGGGIHTDADLDATMSADLDNGVSVSVTIGIDTADNVGEATKSGNLTISGAAGSFIIGNDVSTASFSAVGDTIGLGAEDGVRGFIGSYTFGTTTLFVSAPMTAGQVGLPSDTIEFGVTAEVGGMTVGLGVADEDYVGKVSGAVSGVSYTIAAGEVAGVDRWDVTLSYPVGALTIGYTVDSGTDNPWEASAAYAEGALSAKVTYADATDSFKVEGSYDLGNGVVVNAGYLGATVAGGSAETYVGGTYDLGGGASAYASFVNSDTATFASEIGAQDYHDGTTIGVKFAF
ncbi:porin [Octadecabacter sp.]|nr:porin [Octadecabacter sp.]